MAISESTKNTLLEMQRSEITEYHIYSAIAKRVKDPHNKKVIQEIANQEKEHADTWETYTGVKVKPRRFQIWRYKILSMLLGITFVLRFMERGEDFAQKTYNAISDEVPEAKRVEEEEANHERELLDALDEDRLKYVRSMVLGLNDALVELTGALAGLSFAVSDPRIISLSGLITGIAASLSMAASEYLSTKADGRDDALKSSFYTGGAYVIVVAILILPYLLLDEPMISLAIMLASALFIIFIFNYYMSVALNISFKKRFLQMATISMGVAAFSFLVGSLLRIAFGIDV
ncbi:MAG: VIT1/CCC1 transporter family protein [Bacillota bacterium]